MILIFDSSSRSISLFEHVLFAKPVPTPAIYDLSWLNPTPHAIAVYASQPLSPVATQHSLPSGRYSLLGPDLHRLDRTSWRLAHLLDHLVGASEDGRRNLDAQRFRYLEINEEIEFGWQHYWQFGRLFAFDDAPSIVA